MLKYCSIILAGIYSDTSVLFVDHLLHKVLRCCFSLRIFPLSHVSVTQIMLPFPFQEILRMNLHLWCPHNFEPPPTSGLYPPLGTTPHHCSAIHKPPGDAVP